MVRLTSSQRRTGKVSDERQAGSLLHADEAQQIDIYELGLTLNETAEVQILRNV